MWLTCPAPGGCGRALCPAPTAAAPATASLLADRRAPGPAPETLGAQGSQRYIGRGIPRAHDGADRVCRMLVQDVVEHIHAPAGSLGRFCRLLQHYPQQFADAPCWRRLGLTYGAPQRRRGPPGGVGRGLRARTAAAPPAWPVLGRPPCRPPTHTATCQLQHIQSVCRGMMRLAGSGFMAFPATCIATRRWTRARQQPVQCLSAGASECALHAQRSCGTRHSNNTLRGVVTRGAKLTAAILPLSWQLKTKETMAGSHDQKIRLWKTSEDNEPGS